MPKHWDGGSTQRSGINVVAALARGIWTAARFRENGLSVAIVDAVWGQFHSPRCGRGPDGPLVYPQKRYMPWPCDEGEGLSDVGTRSVNTPALGTLSANRIGRIPSNRQHLEATNPASKLIVLTSTRVLMKTEYDTLNYYSSVL